MKSKNWLGYVYEHIVVACATIGRQIKKGEAVHHLDGNRGNNDPGNLIVLSSSAHTRLHSWIKRGAPGLGSFNKYKGKRK